MSKRSNRAYFWSTQLFTQGGFDRMDDDLLRDFKTTLGLSSLNGWTLIRTIVEAFVAGPTDTASSGIPQFTAGIYEGVPDTPIVDPLDPTASWVWFGAGMTFDSGSPAVVGFFQSTNNNESVGTRAITNDLDSIMIVAAAQDPQGVPWQYGYVVRCLMLAPVGF